MKVVLLFALALLIPFTLLAGPATMGVYFGFVPGQMVEWPQPFVFFDVYIYLHNANCYVSAVEYQLQTPTDPGHMYFVYNPAIRSACKLNHVVTTVSEFSKKDIAKRVKIPLQKIRVINNGVREPNRNVASEVVEALFRRLNLGEDF